MKAVIDTNVFISGIFWKGESYNVLCSWRERKFDIIVSHEILLELIKVLRDFKIKMPEDNIRKWIELIVYNSLLVCPKERVNIIKEDPQDNKFIEAALEGGDYIISQDKHLLRIKEFKGIKIITPKDFNKILFSRT